MVHALMKKSMVLGIVVLFFGASFISIACGIITPNGENTSVTPQEATLAAEAKIQEMGKKGFFIKNQDVIKDKDMVLFYIFTMVPQGYIIVSGQYDLPPVIAYSFTSDFGAIDFKTNPLLHLLRTDILYRIEYRGKLPVEIIKTRSQQWADVLNDRVQTRAFQQWPPEGSTPTGGWILTLWTQSAPYNNFCPLLGGTRPPAGCPAVAMAQILNYHKTTKNTVFSDADDYYHSYGGYNFWIDNQYATYKFPSWPQLNTYLDTLNTHWNQPTTLTNDDMAALNVACGFAMNQVYNPSGSGTFAVSQAYQGYQRFGFTESELLYPSDPKLFDRLSSNMMNALPAHIAVVDPGWTIGHNMVVDGYNTNDYYHINFGWGGSYNGWYLIPNGLPYGLTVVEGVIVDIIPHDHILNLSKFPYYLSQVNSGAMAMKMMLDYLMWNSTTHPQGPPSVYNEQTLYTNYSGGNWINGSEICYGLNAEIDDEHQTPPWSYGYYFAPSANVSATEILKEICVWFDYPIDYYNDVRVVDVPKPGHTNHVPVAVPIYGNYSRWVVIRGIHTDINAWLPPAQLTVYGFWINDPVSGGIGNNTYVTASRFLSTYFRALNVSGDQYNGKFLAVTDPNLEYNQNNIHDMKLSIGETTPAVTLKEVALVRFIENMRTPIRNEEANTIIVKAAFEQIKNILKNDVQGLVSSFEKSNAVGKPLYKDGCWTVQFTNSDTSMTVLLDKDCKLLEFSLT